MADFRPIMSLPGGDDNGGPDFSHLGSRTDRRPYGYTVWLVPEGADEVESVQKDIGAKTFQVYSAALDRLPGSVPDNRRYTKPAEQPQVGVLILPASGCGSSSPEGVKRMTQGVVDAYKGGYIRVAFEPTNNVSDDGGSVHAQIDEKKSDYAQLDELRTALKKRLWGPADAHTSVPTPYVPLLEVSLVESYPSLGGDIKDRGLVAVREQANQTASAFNGVLSALTLTKVLVLGAGEVPIAPKS
ncbi:uncharacterized protein LOC62_03G005116 [Vanrija pseudolonga]|uniref:Uncharacterized protein n=1 Tax=Vanrija pseudolonga TaxID=143232 RepID=A0AAF0YD03_9TREE|nr:hypothetical protein LOC62_03G005116 [Vanrija pseudolonga]